MPTTYSLADPDVRNELASVMARYHERLYAAQVRVAVLMARNPDGPAVKHGGYPALATIKPLPLKDRVLKDADALLVIDEGEWYELKPAQRVALLDHELSHIDTIDRDESDPNEDAGEGASKVTWKTDDIGRPRLKSVKGDWNAGDGFAAVVARHGASAVEFKNLSRCNSAADRARREGEAERDATTDPAREGER